MLLHDDAPPGEYNICYEKHDEETIDRGGGEDACTEEIRSDAEESIPSRDFVISVAPHPFPVGPLGSSLH